MNGWVMGECNWEDSIEHCVQVLEDAGACLAQMKSRSTLALHFSLNADGGANPRGQCGANMQCA